MVEQRRELNFISSWDDGHVLDMKMAALLTKHNLPGIFYIPSLCNLPVEYIQTLAKDFQIGGHTFSHPADLKLLSKEEVRDEVTDNKIYLEEITGKKVESFCYPRGRFNDETIDVLIDAGFKNARTTTVLETVSKDPFRTHTTIHVYPRKEYEGRDWLDLAKMYANKASWEGGVFHIWGHSWEVDDLRQWEKLDEFYSWLNKNFLINKNNEKATSNKV